MQESDATMAVFLDRTPPADTLAAVRGRNDEQVGLRDARIDRHGLVHAFNGPGLGAAIDFDLIERKKIAVLS